MSDKQKILVLLIFIGIVIVIDVGLVFWNGIENQPSSFSNPKKESINCYKKSEWNEIAFNNQNFGEYQKEYYYTFIYEAKENSVRGENKVLYTFTDLSGFQVLDMDMEGEFVETLDDKKLQKTYVSNTFSFVDFLAFKMKDNPLQSYLEALEKFGYICTK